MRLNKGLSILGIILFFSLQAQARDLNSTICYGKLPEESRSTLLKQDLARGHFDGSIGNYNIGVLGIDDGMLVSITNKDSKERTNTLFYSKQSNAFLIGQSKGQDYRKMDIIVGCEQTPNSALMQAVCVNNNSKFVFQTNNLSEGIQIDQKQSQLQSELASLEKLKTLSVTSSANGWNVYTFEGSNKDDTQMIATFVTDSIQKNARLNLQILVDGLKGGTHSEAFECSIK